MRDQHRHRCACVTIGDLERAVGIPRDHASRFAFWRPFAHLGADALDAGTAELHRLIEAKLGTFRLPEPKRRPRSA